MHRRAFDVVTVIYRPLLTQQPKTAELAKQGQINPIPKQVLQIRQVTNDINLSSLQAPILMTAAMHEVPTDNIQLQHILPDTEIVPKDTPIPNAATQDQ